MGRMLLKGKAGLPPSASPGRPEASQRAAGPHRLGTKCFLITAAYWGVGTGASPVSVPHPPCPLQFEMEASGVRVARWGTEGGEKERLLWASEVRPWVSPPSPHP